jgi:hypothetical protein
MVQSAKAEYSSHAFARWFSTMIASSRTADLQEQLKELRQSNDHLDKVLEEASRIVRRNNEEFKFPFSKPFADHQVCQLLLFEWNQHQTENTMASLPVQQTVKSLLPVKVDKSRSLGTALSIVKAPQVVYQTKTSNFLCFDFFNSLEPMCSGIAIGAP